MRVLLKYFFIITFIVCINVDSFCQNFNRNYTSSWASTRWEFVFKKDGSYVRTSDGFYGKTVIEGKYRVKKDTLYILTGYENAHGTINTKYLLHTDSLMVDLKNYYFYQRLPTYKGSKKAIVCITGVEPFAPDSIYIKHPEFLPRLNESRYGERYWGSYERYVLKDSITGTIIDYIKGVEPDPILFDSWHGHRSGKPAVYLLTDSSGDYFLVVDSNFENNLKIGDQVKVYPAYCYNEYIKTEFSSDLHIKFMVCGNVRLATK